MERSTQSGSSPLVSRKRDGGSLDALERPDDPKRRATSVLGDEFSRDLSPFELSSPATSPGSIDILDLTGFDVDADSTAIAELIMMEQPQARKQHFSFKSQELPSSREDLAAAAPGLDDPNANGDSSDDANPLGLRSIPAPGASIQTGGSHSLQTSPTSSTLPSQRLPVPVKNRLERPQSYGQPLPQLPDYSRIPGFRLPPTGSSLHFKMPPESGFTMVSTHTSAQGGLSDSVKARMLAFAMGVDEFGRPLPDRLQDYLADTFDDPAVTQQELDNLLKNIQPDRNDSKLKTDDTPEGLKGTLYPHQALALTWMKSMEDGTNKGGILADDMGLGKTVSTLALMLSRPATSKLKTNLIIGPLSLIRQWEEEIINKTKRSHRLNVFIYHNKKASTDDLLQYDVVLTTYGTIAKEHQRLKDLAEEKRKERSHIDFGDPSLRTKFPLLHPGKAFHRVILDEAQFIKNRKTNAAKACHDVKATFRWCLTGTPMMNNVLELFSLICFLRIRPYCFWQTFRDDFGALFGNSSSSKNVAMTRFRALLKAVMLRRKKDSKIDNQPIFELPAKTEEVVYADLSRDERDYYNQLEKRSQVQFNKYLRAGSIGKNYSSILVLLLRLRQACCHPHLNLDVEDVGLTASDTEMTQLVSNLNETIVSRIKAADILECPICYDFAQSPSFFPCAHMSCALCMIRLTDGARALNLQNGVDSDTAKCPVCRAEFVPKNCFTYKAFQKVHMPEAILARKQQEEENKANLGEVKGEIKEEKLVNIRPSMLRALRKEASKSRQAYEEYMAYLRQTWLPAAKVSECIKLLKQAMKDGEKVIVFSQWTLLLDLMQIGLAFEEEFKRGSGNEFRRYDGSMSSDERFKAAREFRDEESVMIMLVSLRAGNAGLNLTAASRVIIMDPFWNPYIERQAIDRAYRMGQLRKVRVYRILTKDTVEDRIVELQEKKEEMVEAALDENEGRKISRLGEAELRFLFNARR